MPDEFAVGHAAGLLVRILPAQTCVLSNATFCYHLGTSNSSLALSHTETVSTSAFNSNTPLFDPASIEARLNALTGPTNDQPSDDHEPDLRQQLLADESLSFLQSCHSECSDQGETRMIIQLFRVAVLPHQSRLVLHCSFVPDLPASPKIEAEVIDRQARVRVTDALTFAARLEITLATPVENPSSLCIEVVTTSLQPINEIGPNQKPN